MTERVTNESGIRRIVYALQRSQIRSEFQLRRWADQDESWTLSTWNIGPKALETVRAAIAENDRSFLDRFTRYDPVDRISAEMIALRELIAVRAEVAGLQELQALIDRLGELENEARAAVHQ